MQDVERKEESAFFCHHKQQRHGVQMWERHSQHRQFAQERRMSGQKSVVHGEQRQVAQERSVTLLSTVVTKREVEVLRAQAMDQGQFQADESSQLPDLVLPNPESMELGTVTRQFIQFRLGFPATARPTENREPEAPVAGPSQAGRALPGLQTRVVTHDTKVVHLALFLCVTSQVTRVVVL